jgi:hypothetical protein
MELFHKLENYVGWDNALFALRGQVLKTMDCSPIDGMIMKIPIGYYKTQIWFLIWLLEPQDKTKICP